MPDATYTKDACDVCVLYMRPCNEAVRKQTALNSTHQLGSDLALEDVPGGEASNGVVHV